MTLIKSSAVGFWARSVPTPAGGKEGSRFELRLVPWPLGCVGWAAADATVDDRDPASARQLLGRAAECGEIERLLGSVRGGLSGALVLRGEPGIGKTALLEYAAGLATDMHLLRLVGIESEMELGYAALHQLLLPFLGDIDVLPVRDAGLWVPLSVGG